jgi:hypothetical protein
MTKYEQAKYLVKTKARIFNDCCICDQVIKPGDYYYKETIDMQKPPSLVLKAYCKNCGEKTDLESF